jgi:hypothetical protein
MLARGTAFVLFIATLAQSVAGAVTQKRMLDCTIDSQSIDDCSMDNYFTRVGVFAAPGIIMFLLLWLCCPFYCGAKYCCNCCGGRGQTPNCCCPSNKYPARYSQGDLVRPRIYAFVALVVAAGALGWGFSGLFTLIDGLDGLQGVLSAVPDTLQGRINVIEEALIVNRYHANNDSTTVESLFGPLKDSTTSVRDDLKSGIDGIMDTYREFVGYFTKAVIALFCIPVGAMLLGQIASLCSARTCFPMTVVWTLFIFGGLLWLGHGVFSGLSMMIGDVCAEVQGMVNQQTNVLPIVLGCKDSIFDQFRNDFKSIENVQAAATCGMLMAHCYDSSQSVTQNLQQGTYYVCPSASTTNCTSMSFGRLLTLSDTFWYIHPDISSTPGSGAAGYTCYASSICSFKACSSECRVGSTSGGDLSIVGKNSKELYTSFLAVNQVSNAIDTVGAQYSNCDSVMTVVMGPASGPCNTITDGLVFARQSSGVEGIAIIIGLFGFVWGAKRFMKLDEAGKPQMPDSRPKKGTDEL